MKSRKNTAGTFVRIVIIIVLAVLIGGVLLFNFFFKTDGTPSSIFGIYFLRTNEVYMETEIMPGDMIIAMEAEPSDLNPDDVVICKFRDRITVMRITAVNPGVPVSFSVKYDTAPETDAFSIGAENIIARAKYKDAVLGKLLDVATSVPGIIVAVIIPLTLIIIYQITRFAGNREDADEDEEYGGEGIVRERSGKTVSERTADLTEMLSERELDDPAISLTDFKDIKAELDSLKEAEPQKQTGSVKLAIDERGRAVVQKHDFEATRQIAPNAYTKPAPSRTETSDRANSFARTEVSAGIAAPSSSHTAGFSRTYEAAKASDPVVFLKPEPLPQSGSVTRIGDLVRDNETSREDEAVREMLRPKPASVIPESINRAQQSASKTAPSEFEDSVREYYKKEDTRVTPAESFAEPAASSIPPGAAVPKENIAPVRRKKSTRTIDELMKIIDSEAGKISK
jgi:hypothetical protein